MVPREDSSCLRFMDGGFRPCRVEDLEVRKPRPSGCSSVLTHLVSFAQLVADSGCRDAYGRFLPRTAIETVYSNQSRRSVAVLQRKGQQNS